MSPKLSDIDLGEVAAHQGEAMDQRYHLAAAMKRQINKVFPTHWSFLLG
jgi:ubiquinol-cytochrome c reductase cytochrome b subunit